MDNVTTASMYENWLCIRSYSDEQRQEPNRLQDDASQARLMQLWLCLAWRGREQPDRQRFSQNPAITDFISHEKKYLFRPGSWPG
jgi:hypothetical protein